MKRVLVICTGNSCRSQMAEAILRTVKPHIHVCSAGVQPAKAVATNSITVLQEKGYPTNGLYPKDVTQFYGEQFDIVVTVCNHAQQQCPVFPHAHSQIHVPFTDPYMASGTPNEVLDVYRHVRDEIEQWEHSLDW